MFDLSELRSVRWIALGFAALVGLAAQARAQATLAGAAPTPTGDQAAPPDARLISALAALRNYPDPLIDDLLSAARQPDWLSGAAQSLRAGVQPDVADLAPGARESAERLLGVPDAVLIAGANPEALNRVRAAYDESPQRAAALLGHLRQRYAELERSAAHAWQDALERDSSALGEYRQWLSEFSVARQRESTGFVVLRVANPSAYLAAVPSGRALAELRRTAPENLRIALERWEREFGPEQRDRAAQRLESAGATPPGDARYVVDWPAERRQELWTPVQDNIAASGDLIPADLIPPNDQRGDVRLLVALDEHERGWGAPPGLPAPQIAAHSDPIAEGSIPPQTAYADPDAMAAYEPQPYDLPQVEVFETDDAGYLAEVGVDYGTTYVESYPAYGYSYGRSYTYGGYCPPPIVSYGHGYVGHSSGYSLGVSFGHSHGAYCTCRSCSGYSHSTGAVVLYNAANAHAGAHPLYRPSRVSVAGRTPSRTTLLRSGERSITARSFPLAGSTRAAPALRPSGASASAGYVSRSSASPSVRSPSPIGKSSVRSNPVVRTPSAAPRTIQRAPGSSGQTLQRSTPARPSRSISPSSSSRSSSSSVIRSSDRSASPQRAAGSSRSSRRP